MGMGALVLAALLLSLISLAVTVELPAVLSVRLKVCVPFTRVVLAGKVALLSEALIPTVSVTVLTAFQLASTALTVTVKALPAACAAGVPVFPMALPGAAVSPGARICSLVNGPELTITEGLVLAVIPVCVTSEAATVALPAVFSVKLKLPVPLTRAALAGKTALESLEVIATVSFVPITFQLASTALMVTVNMAPAIWGMGVPIFPVAVPGVAGSPGART